MFDVPDAKRKRRSLGTMKSRVAFVTSSLKATALIDETSGKHSGPGNRIFQFPVDDQIAFLVVNVESDNAPGVSLTNPSGMKYSDDILGKVVLYQVDKPAIGKWSISIPPGSGDYRCKVTAKLKRPIAFVPKYFALENKITNQYLTQEKVFIY